MTKGEGEKEAHKNNLNNDHMKKKIEDHRYKIN